MIRFPLGPVWIVVCVAVGVVACKGGSPPSSSGDSGGVPRLSGNERLAWDQPAGSQEELWALSYHLYVDGQLAPNSLQDMQCGSIGGNQSAVCSGRLVALPMGQHTLTLASVAPDGTESQQSGPLQVLVVTNSLTAAVVREAATPANQAVPDNIKLETVSVGLEDPRDLAVTTDQRVLVAERRGQVKIVTNGVLQTRPATTLDDVWAGDGAGLLGIALDPAFQDNHYVYVVYTTTQGFRLARFRESAGTLGERAILLDGIAASPNALATVRFGPDAKLYVSFDDGDDAGTAGDLGTFSGKVLRVNTDGTVPDDQAGLTPVFVPDVSAGRALDWNLRGSLWIAEGRADGSGVLDAVVDETRYLRRGRIAARYRLPDGRVPSGALFYRGSAMKEWAGDLLVALPDAQQLIRLHFDPSDATRVEATQIVIDMAAGSIRALAATKDGVLYLANDDRLFALRPTATGTPAGP